MFVRECRLEWTASGLVAVRAVAGCLDANERALALLGWEFEARAAWLHDLTRAPLRSYGDAATRAKRAGVSLTGIDPAILEPVPRAIPRAVVANTAMMYRAEAAAGVRALLHDLNRLAATSRSQRGGPVGILLGGADRQPTRPDHQAVAVVLPSNVAQDQAISASRRSPLTVVTGPPGTGKSQVLVNAVAATVIAGQTVLVAARTNRAVDVLFERLQGVPGGLSLRAGRAGFRARAADQIRDALATVDRAPRSPRTAADAAEAWSALARRLAPMYRLLGQRAEEYQRWLDAHTNGDLIAASWGWDLSGSAPAGVRAQAAAYEAVASQAAAALGRLPPDEALRARLAGFEARRLASGEELWRMAWSRRGGHAPATARNGAMAVASQLERGHPSEAAFRSALRAFPVWGLTNLAAGSCLPFAPELFDLVIIDEASQCDVASALPLLARARRALIIGDEHQLGHVSRLSPEREAAIARRHGLDVDDVHAISQRRCSLYDVATARLGRPPLLLDEHYRCHPRVIGFVNDRVYAGGLTIRTPLTHGGGLFWRNVAGSFRRGPDGRSADNPEEAVAVVEQLQRERTQHPSARIGVVAPFRAQVELIRQLLRSHDRSPAALSNIVTVDTVHRFQGDERDIMLLSPTVSVSMPSFFRTVAGQLRLLNVAITRARHRLVVVGDRDACLATGGLLAELAAYATPITDAGMSQRTAVIEEPGREPLAVDCLTRRQAPTQPS
jgi:hypothetical protein